MGPDGIRYTSPDGVTLCPKCDHSFAAHLDEGGDITICEDLVGPYHGAQCKCPFLVENTEYPVAWDAIGVDTRTPQEREDDELLDLLTPEPAAKPELLTDPDDLAITYQDWMSSQLFLFSQDSPSVHDLVPPQFMVPGQVYSTQWGGTLEWPDPNETTEQNTKPPSKS